MAYLKCRYANGIALIQNRVGYDHRDQIITLDHDQIEELYQFLGGIVNHIDIETDHNSGEYPP